MFVVPAVKSPLKFPVNVTSVADAELLPIVVPLISTACGVAVSPTLKFVLT